MDRTDLGLANSLFSRYLNYREALALKDAKIVAFTLEGESDLDEDGETSTETNQLTVSAEGIQTPPQMLTAITEQIGKRIEEINEQLTKMGVSESEVPQRAQEARTSPPAPRTPSSPPTASKPASPPARPAHGHPNAKGRR